MNLLNKAIIEKNWEKARKLLRRLNKMNYVVIVHSSEEMPYEISSLVCSFQRPINFLQEMKPVLDKFDIGLKPSEKSYNDFIVSAVIYSAMLSKGPKVILVKFQKSGYFEISYTSDRQNDNFLPFCYAILGVGENYSSQITTSNRQLRNSRTIRCKIPVSREEIDRKEGYCVNNDGFIPNNLTFVKQLAGGSYAHTTLVKDQNKNEYYVLKAAKEKGFDKLREEISWLKNIPESAKSMFPEICEDGLFEGTKTSWVWMLQKYYPWPSVTSLLMNDCFNKNTDYTKNTFSILSFLINVLRKNKEIFYIKQTEPTPLNFFEHFHASKIKTRLSETMTADESLETFLNAEYIEVDGDRLIGAKELLKCFEIIQNETDLFSPPYLSSLHGDHNVGNLLVDPSFFEDTAYEDLRYKLVDPRGWIEADTSRLKGQDYIYDLCKVAYHFFGYYDQTRANWIDVSALDSNSTVPRLAVKISGYDEVENKFQNSAMKQYFYLQAAFLKYLAKEQNFLGLEEVNLWKIRFMFTLGSCMISDIPFLLKGSSRNNRALTIYVLGLRFFNLALEMGLKYLDNSKEDKNKALAVSLRCEYPIFWKTQIDKSTIETIILSLGERLSPVSNIYL